MNSDNHSNNMKVFLGGRELNISCPEGAEDRLNEAVALFNNELSSRNPNNSYERNVISAGLNLANALLDAQDELVRLEHETQAKLDLLQQKFDEQN